MNTQAAYDLAREQYAEWGVDAAHAMEVLSGIPISLHCWQGDDVGGFEGEHELGGGLAATGNYPGKARTADELRRDLTQALKLIPGRHRLNLHAIYAETHGKKVERDQLAPEHFAGWVDWAKKTGLHGMDFNPTCFSHPMADSGFTLSSRDKTIREFWVRHCIACRHIGAYFARELQGATVVNVWIPDGMKDTPVDRWTPREILCMSLNTVFAEKLDTTVRRVPDSPPPVGGDEMTEEVRAAIAHAMSVSVYDVYDSVESKLFGIGSESYVVGSHEFYLGYAIANNKLLCLDTGHFHPTEGVADKISAVMTYLERILLHVSRGVRWDSDHVVILSDELQAIANEIVRGGFLERVHIGLDYFDASINRVAAWVIGTRCMLKALLIALLEPTAKLAEMEANGDFTGRLALMEEAKTLPFGAVWDHYCQAKGVAVGGNWLDEVRKYEREVLSKR